MSRNFFWWFGAAHGAFTTVATVNTGTRSAAVAVSLNRVWVGNVVGGIHSCGIAHYSGIENGQPFTGRVPPLNFEGAVSHPQMTSATVYARSDTPGGQTHAVATFDLL